MKCKNYGILCKKKAYKNAINQWLYCTDCLKMINYASLKKYKVIK